MSFSFVTHIPSPEPFSFDKDRSSFAVKVNRDWDLYARYPHWPLENSLGPPADTKKLTRENGPASMRLSRR